MPDGLRVFVNERSCTLPAGALVRDALRATVPDLIPACESGEAFVTDGRGLPVALDSSLESGAILRAARSSRRSSSGVEADAGA